jgi:hypothetical protein
VGPECASGDQPQLGVELLVDLSPADAVRGLQAEYGLSERQARRYVNEALARPDGVVVPERTVVFTVRLAPSLIAGLRAHARASGVSLSAATAVAVGAYLEQAGERPGGPAR